MLTILYKVKKIQLYYLIIFEIKDYIIINGDTIKKEIFGR